MTDTDNETTEEEAQRFAAIGDSDLRGCGCYRSEHRERDGWAATKTLACPLHQWVGTDLQDR